MGLRRRAGLRGWQISRWHSKVKAKQLLDVVRLVPVPSSPSAALDILIDAAHAVFPDPEGEGHDGHEGFEPPARQVRPGS